MAIDFELDPLVEQIRDFVHEFAVTNLRPIAREADEKPIGSMVAVVGSEELAWGDPAVLLNIPGPGLAAPSIKAAGTEDQKQRFLPDIFEAEIGEPRVGALAV